MKTLVVICLALPALAFSQLESQADSNSVLLPDTVEIAVIPPVIDTINVTDSLGMKQGYWMFLGSDFPNSGVASSELLEDGRFVNNQRVGLWYRYGAGGQVKAVMNYRLDPKTKVSARDQFYYYEYYPTGTLKKKPAIGGCRTASDYYRYNEAGELVEAELFDSLCNTTYKLQHIQKGEMDSVSIFLVDQRFHEPSVTAEDLAENSRDFDQTGEYCVDHNHRIFQVGWFENGNFIAGKEFLVDEMMRPQRVRYFEDGKMIRTLVR